MCAMIGHLTPYVRTLTEAHKPTYRFDFKKPLPSSPLRIFERREMKGRVEFFLRGQGGFYSNSLTPSCGSRAWLEGSKEDTINKAREWDSDLGQCFSDCGAQKSSIGATDILAKPWAML